MALTWSLRCSMADAGAATRPYPANSDQPAAAILLLLAPWKDLIDDVIPAVCRIAR
jgi:hypothetical protein